MTQQQIDGIKTYRQVREDEMENIDNQTDVLRKRKEQLEEECFDLDARFQCDHLLPNGKSAGDGGCLYSHCTICGSS